MGSNTIDCETAIKVKEIPRFLRDLGESEQSTRCEKSAIFLHATADLLENMEICNP